MAATGNFTSFDDFLEMYENLTPEQTRRLEEARARKLGSRTSSYGNRTQYSNEIEDILETEISHSTCFGIIFADVVYRIGTV